MGQVVDEAKLAWLETPDQAMVWAVALGLQHQAEQVLERSRADLQDGRAAAGTVWFPAWYGTSSSFAGAAAGGVAAVGLLGVGRARLWWNVECLERGGSCCWVVVVLEDATRLEVWLYGPDLSAPRERDRAERGRVPEALFARLWLHYGFVNVDTEKMSKSLGNFVTCATARAQRRRGAPATSSSARTTAARSSSTPRSCPDGRVVFPGRRRSRAARRLPVHDARAPWRLLRPATRPRGRRATPRSPRPCAARPTGCRRRSTTI